MATDTTAGYNRLAPWYALLERLAFGGLLQRAREGLIGELADCRDILVVGEGDGRMLQSLLSQSRHARVDVVEQSPRMIELGRTRLRNDDLARVHFYDCRVESFQATKAYDAVITTFILDSFAGDELQCLVSKIDLALSPEARWYFADFHIPDRGWARWHSQAWLWLMYRFFNWQTKLDVRRLDSPDAALANRGWAVVAEQQWRWGLIVTRVYCRSR